ncbi:hypothetical protein QBC34DRAFT_440688 [Podospora aff. communis PSN243]|uniref:Uncharacterized protein n=1 Tax=Podospora aff. communis PSN243 TaxID=3040156 RepID=A0AAV9GEN7_9PEZI|nr:hypothetical protein QBC34DRAFT_440688 [Podospora aff. communis PSN243]
MVRTMMAWFSMTRVFDLHSGDLTWWRVLKPVVRAAAAGMPNLERVGFYLTGNPGGTIQAMVEDEQVSRFKDIHLTIYDQHHHKQDGQNRDPIRPGLHVRSWPVTSLSLVEYVGTPDTLAPLLSLPRCLAHFWLSFCNAFDVDRRWTIPTVVALLSPHSSTLRSIGIGSMVRSNLHDESFGIDTLNLAPFPVLEQLTLSIEGTGITCSPDAILTGPRLCKFIWDLTTCETSWCTFHPLLEDQESWIRGLISKASTYSLVTRKVPECDLGDGCVSSIGI